MTRRQATTLAMLAPLSAVGGCEWLRNMTQPDKKPAAATGSVPPKSREELVTYLNRQSDALVSVKYPRVLIELKAGGETHSLNDSSLICSKSRNFSLVGGKGLISNLVNLGSNDTEFWVYNRFGDPKYVFCSHADFERGTAQLPFPFDADWALQALGMGYYDPNRPYRVETDQAAREHRLSYEVSTPQGATVRRTVVFAGDSTGDKSPQVRRHLIADAAGKPIATADIKDVVTLSAGRGKSGDKDVMVQVPTEVVLEWPQQQFRMRLQLRSPKVNEPISDADARELFTRPAISGVVPVNLASLQSSPRYRGATPGRELPPRSRGN